MYRPPPPTGIAAPPEGFVTSGRTRAYDTAGASSMYRSGRCWRTDRDSRWIESATSSAELTQRYKVIRERESVNRYSDDVYARSCATC